MPRATDDLYPRPTDLPQFCSDLEWLDRMKRNRERMNLPDSDVLDRLMDYLRFTLHHVIDTRHEHRPLAPTTDADSSESSVRSTPIRSTRSQEDSSGPKPRPSAS